MLAQALQSRHGLQLVVMKRDQQKDLGTQVPQGLHGMGMADAHAEAAGVPGVNVVEGIDKVFSGRVQGRVRVAHPEKWAASRFGK